MSNARRTIASIAVCLASACSDGGARQGSKDDAGDGEQLDAAPASNGDEDASAAEDVGRDEDSAASEEAGSGERDGQTSLAMDAGGESPDGAPASGDAHVASTDGGGATCVVEAGRDSSCVAQLCEIDGSTALALDNDQQWRVGAADWNAMICGQPVGSPGGTISDWRLVYSLTGTQLEQIKMGAPVQAYYGSPQGRPPGVTPLDCAVELRDPTPACRDMR